MNSYSLNPPAAYDEGSTSAHENGPVWLFSRTVDLLAFAGSAAASGIALLVGAHFGWLKSGTPEWTWVTAILLIDVAHVYSTGFKVYWNRDELSRRPWLYGVTPIAAFMVGAAVYSESSLLFWRILAYLAVFHFVRQQYGWIALYRSKAGEISRVGKWIDSSAIYLATLYPLIWWHANLPRNFYWFLNQDFVAMPALVVSILTPLYWLSMILYAARAIYRAAFLHQYNPGKDLVLITTALCWYVGIITFNSDYAFTVTNVIIHGVPYMVLVYWTNQRPREQGRENRASNHVRRLVVFVATIWLLAYAEELLWDRGVWHDHGWLFGKPFESNLSSWLVPLLAVPQITHYVLDGFIWKRKSNPRFAQWLGSFLPNKRPGTP